MQNYDFIILQISRVTNYLTLRNGMMARMTAKAVWMEINIHASQTIAMDNLLVAASTYFAFQWQIADDQFLKLPKAT